MITREIFIRKIDGYENDYWIFVDYKYEPHWFYQVLFPWSDRSKSDSWMTIYERVDGVWRSISNKVSFSKELDQVIAKHLEKSSCV